MWRALFSLAVTAVVVVASPGPARAGTTILTHGFALLSTQPPDWALSMGRAILAAAGDLSDCGDIGGATPVGTLFTYDPASGAWQHECGSTTPNGEIVLVFNWTEESDGLNPGGTQGYAGAAADALYAALRDPDLPSAFASLDLLASDVHFLGHSRGAVVNSDCVERLAAASIIVDHVTTLDPHPVDGTLDYPLDSADWGDVTPVTWNNVDVTDNYWRADGGGARAADFDGIDLGADVDLDLGSAIEAFPDIDPVFEHSEVRAWYYGTIDLSATDDGDGTAIDNEFLTDWYGAGGIPARGSTGFYYSAIAEGTRPPALPGLDPSHDPLTIYNGDFETVNTEIASLGIGYAGWLYHGGDKSGVLVPWSSADPPPGSSYYLTLDSGADDRSLTHNRLFVDPGVSHVTLLRRVSTASANDRFRIFLGDGTSDFLVVDDALLATTGWWTQYFPVGSQHLGKTYTLRVEIDGGGDGIESVVDVDDLRFLPEPDFAVSLFAGISALLAFGRERARA